MKVEAYSTKAQADKVAAGTEKDWLILEGLDCWYIVTDEPAEYIK